MPVANPESLGNEICPFQAKALQIWEAKILTPKKACWRIVIGNFLTFLIQMRPNISMLIPSFLVCKMVQDGLIIEHFIISLANSALTKIWTKPTCCFLVVLPLAIFVSNPFHNLKNAQPYWYAFCPRVMSPE